MDADSTPRPMSPALSAIVEEAYRIFARYRPGGDLYVCNCPSCMTAEAARELLTTSLRKIPASLLAEYTNSAHTYDEDPVVADELRYFLPRYFDLIAAGEPPDSLGLDTCLRRLGQADYRKNWPQPEVQCIDRFYDAVLVDAVARLDLAEWPVGWRLAFDTKDVLTLVVTGGGDVDRLLRTWEEAADPAAAVHMASLRSDVIEERDRTYLHSAYFDTYKDAADRIGTWLMRPQITRRIENAYAAVTDVRLQLILAEAVTAPDHWP